MPRYANVDKLMKHSIRMDWSILRWVNEVDICTAINPNVVERKRGKWRHYEGYLTCSECRTEYDDDIMTHCCDDVPRFCPNCGADMREESENE